MPPPQADRILQAPALQISACNPSANSLIALTDCFCSNLVNGILDDARPPTPKPPQNNASNNLSVLSGSSKQSSTYCCNLAPVHQRPACRYYQRGACHYGPLCLLLLLSLLLCLFRHARTSASLSQSAPTCFTIPSTAPSRTGAETQHTVSSDCEQKSAPAPATEQLSRDQGQPNHDAAAQPTVTVTSAPYSQPMPQCSANRFDRAVRNNWFKSLRLLPEDHQKR